MRQPEPSVSFPYQEDHTAKFFSTACEILEPAPLISKRIFFSLLACFAMSQWYLIGRWRAVARTCEKVGKLQWHNDRFFQSLFCFVQPGNIFKCQCHWSLFNDRFFDGKFAAFAQRLFTLYQQKITRPEQKCSSKQVSSAHFDQRCACKHRKAFRDVCTQSPFPLICFCMENEFWDAPGGDADSHHDSL